MSFDIEGKLVKKYDAESKSPTFQTREFVIEVNSGNYPEFVKFQLTQDRCSLIESYHEGDRIRVHFDLRGREWQGKYFTNLKFFVKKVCGNSLPNVFIFFLTGKNRKCFPLVGKHLRIIRRQRKVLFS